MKRLVEYTKILRSKNAGPLYITFDLIFETKETYEYVKQRLNKEMIAKAYQVNMEKIDMIPYEVVNSIKVTFPRKHISGCLAETDVYGCQQHMPLANIEI